MQTPYRKRYTTYCSYLVVVLLCSFSYLSAQVNPSRNILIPQASITANNVTLLWDKPIEYNNVIAYKIFRDGKYIGSTRKTNYTATGLAAHKKYSFYIQSESSTGAVSKASEIVTCQTKPAGAVFNIVDFGAKADGITKNTKAIQNAIDACTKNGTVYIPAGVFVSGALYLKSNMTLYIAEGGTLKGSTEVSDYYPMLLNRFEGWEMKTLASLLNAGTLDRNEKYNVVNLSIEGKGTIYGGGSTLGNAMIKEMGIRGRGRLICIMNGQHINIQGLRIENAPCWTIHYIYSNQVTLHDLNIISTARNGDGIDPDSSTDSYIFNCSFSTGDDCIAIKSGKNPEGYTIGKPTRNVRITNCDFVKGHSLAIGSEMSGGVSDVFIQDCTIGNLMHGLQIKATKDRGGYVRNVIARDCDLLKITLYTEINYNNDGAAAPTLPLLSDMEFSNLNLTAAKPGQTIIDINGFADEAHYTKNIVFDKLQLPSQSVIRIKNGAALTFKKVTCADGNPPIYQTIDSKNIITNN
jgi:polygalacturonase